MKKKAQTCINVMVGTQSILFILPIGKNIETLNIEFKGLKGPEVNFRETANKL